MFFLRFVAEQHNTDIAVNSCKFGQPHFSGFMHGLLLHAYGPSFNPLQR